MKSRRDLIQRTFESLGIVRPGGNIQGDMFRSADQRLQDYLLELDEDPRGPLDFDPTASAIPDERMSLLSMCFAGIVGPQYGFPVDPLAWERAQSRLFAAIIGPSDFIEDEPRDF